MFFKNGNSKELVIARASNVRINTMETKVKKVACKKKLSK
jgi:hypothetical protein